MPPKTASQPARAKGPPARPLGGPAATSQLARIPDHVKALGVKRPDYGTKGRPLNVVVNAYEVDFKEGMIYHYDVGTWPVRMHIQPSSTSQKVNMMVINRLQNEVAADIFNPPAVFDGKKNLYAPRRLALGDKDSGQFTVASLDDPVASDGKRKPRPYKVKLTKVNEINTSVLRRYLDQKQSLDEFVLTAITALNIATRMQPSQRYVFNSRSFFTDEGKRAIGRGIELWRGVFQSLRPAVGKLIINVDNTTGIMYKPGPLLDLCREYANAAGPNDLSPPNGLNEDKRRRLGNFIKGLRVMVSLPSKPPKVIRAGTIKGISRVAANVLTFDLDGKKTAVSKFFEEKYNIKLRLPQLFCVQIGSTGAMYPAELCTVPEGQWVPRWKFPNDKTKDVVEFASIPPVERFRHIERGASQVLAFAQSRYIEQFGMTVNTNQGLMNVPARQLPPGSVQYGKATKGRPTLEPRDGSWNLRDKTFFESPVINEWVIVVYDNRFKDQSIQQMINGIIQECKCLGIKLLDEQPPVKRYNGQGDIIHQLMAAGNDCKAEKGKLPNLIMVVLPEGGDGIYRDVKYFGDILTGVATQCVKSSKAFNAKSQYWANVLAKVNAKLGGMNHVLDASQNQILCDSRNPVIVMGADVMRVPNRPAYPALVGSVDSRVSKYVSTIRAQTTVKELIEELEDMCIEILKLHISYKKSQEKGGPPKKLIFYRDGVSEGQFSQVLEHELPMIKRACKAVGIDPKITLLIVGKRHHFRFKSLQDAKGHTLAGTVVDTVITNPLEFEWYLQSHKPLLGTSRPAHYTVIHDDNQFNSDTLQAITYAMCHVYARSTSAVSIPAPVYYADIICARAPIHYAPGTDPSTISETMTNKSDAEMLEIHKNNFKKLSKSQTTRMYFM